MSAGPGPAGAPLPLPREGGSAAPPLASQALGPLACPRPGLERPCLLLGIQDPGTRASTRAPRSAA